MSAGILKSKMFTENEDIWAMINYRLRVPVPAKGLHGS